MKKPVVAWHNQCDATKNIGNMQRHFQDINVIKTKNFSDELVKMLLIDKRRIFLHATVTGMSGTYMELGTQPIKEFYFHLEKLLKSGFPVNQLLINIPDIPQNNTGLEATKLLTRIFTDHNKIRAKHIRMTPIPMFKNSRGVFVPSNQNIGQRKSWAAVENDMQPVADFWHNFRRLSKEVSNHAVTDTGNLEIIGYRELRPFTPDTKGIIKYQPRSRKPQNTVPLSSPVSCGRGCVLCPFKNN